jgi:hypothetical protein
MNRLLVQLFAFNTSLLLTVAPAKAIIYNEAVSGELSKDPFTPTALTLTPGLNSLIGTVVASSQDWVSFTIPAGFVMTSYVNSKYVSTDDQGFTGFQFGSSFLGDELTAGSYAGYAHFGFAANNPDGNPVAASTVGVDLLPLMANPNFAPGATGFTAPLAAGTYTFLIQQGPGGTIRYQFDMTVTPAVTPRLGNISTRASVQTGDGVIIAGFILTGTDLKQVVVRGLGPTLTQFGVSGVLADPTLQLVNSSGNTLFINDNWKDTQQAGIQATGLAPPNDLESAIRIALQPGKYTAILSGNNNTTGVGLAEVYDIEAAVPSALTNVSTRGFVGTGDNVMIAGIITSGGNSSTQIVVRGLGPTLGQPPFNVPNVLADPELTLVDSNGTVVRSDRNWKDTQQAAIQATGLAPPNDLEAAILATVAAGHYTAILSGNGGTGISLVEVYKLR